MEKNVPVFMSATLLVLALILMPESSALAIENDPNLVGYWQFDGDANDAAGSNHGTLIGDPVWVEDPNRGWCLDFDGDGDYVDVGEDPSLTFTDAITVACWIKVRAFDRNWNAIITKGDDWVLARTRSDNRIAFLCLGLTGGGWPEVYSDDVNDGDWHHIAGVYDGSMLYMYRDGESVDSKTVRGGINSKWSRVLIGENGQTFNRCWNGLIDEVRIYDRALTADEIIALANPEPVAPPPPPPPPAPNDVTAVGHDSRIDLKWSFNTDPNLEGYNIYRADSNDGPFTKLNDSVHTVSVYSDFFGENDRRYYYYVRSVAILEGGESEPSNIASAASYAMDDEQLLTSVQEAVFRYFWDYGHPVSGLAREGYELGHSTDTCTSGGTGMGMMAMCVGADREFVTRAQAASRVLQILTFMEENAVRYHGAWSHWINGATGETKPFGEYDDGGDIVETSYVIQGMLTVRQYFDDPNDPNESEIRERATRMWEQVEWDWYLQHPDSEVLYWHWSPNYEWQLNHAVTGYNECMITYLLAIASPTHPIPASCYYNGWAGSADYVNGNTYYDYLQSVGPEKGGPLFFTHYSHLGFDPRDKSDNFCNYFENSMNISFINRSYCIENPHEYAGYSYLVWGLTACFNPWGYSAHSPTHDNGTIAPTAALSAMPYVPRESIATLKKFYYTYGEDLWGPFGFYDAFNLSQDWFAPGCVAIDQGPIVIMIENYRTQLCWNLFMANPEIQPMLNAIGWTSP
jgi:hypothetical protein